MHNTDGMSTARNTAVARHTHALNMRPRSTREPAGAHAHRNAPCGKTRDDRLMGEATKTSELCGMQVIERSTRRLPQVAPHHGTGRLTQVDAPTAERSPGRSTTCRRRAGPRGASSQC